MLTASDLKISKILDQDRKGVFTFEPLPLGFGNTLGNTLRRVLYTSLEGGAITQVKLGGVVHQFSTMPGVKEDVVEITLNLKQVRVKMHTKNPVIGSVNKKGPGIVTAGDIDFPSDAEVVNKELVIATLADAKSKFEAEIVVESGVGFSPIEERETSKVGVILLDCVFSPVVAVSYTVEPARFGKRVDLDKLTLTVETDGTISAWEAVSKSAEILTDFFKAVAIGGPDESEDGPVVVGGETAESQVRAGKKNLAIEDLTVSNRAINALKKYGLKTVKDLADMSDSQIYDIKNLGEKSVAEIMELLKKEGYR